MKKQNVIFKLSAMVLILLFFSSCQKYKKEIAMLNSSNDSIQQIADEKNNKILDYVASFNEIQSNLDSIKRVQKLLNINLSTPSGEINKSDKDKIIEDIALINNMLNENKKLIAILQQRLKNSNQKISELEKMILNYSKQIEEKDAEIVQLNNQLQRMQIDISTLNQKVSDLNDESQRKSETIEQQKDEMNTVYYCFGSKTELVDNKVIEKTGGFIGLGKTMKLRPDFNHDYFKKVDIRDFSEIMLMVKKAQLVTPHPDSTYHFTGTDKTVENFVIDNPREFWKASKYLVILVEP